MPTLDAVPATVAPSRRAPPAGPGPEESLADPRTAQRALVAAVLAALLLAFGVLGTGWPDPAPLGDEVAPLRWPWLGAGFALAPTTARLLGFAALVMTFTLGGLAVARATRRQLAAPLTVLLAASHPGCALMLLRPQQLPVSLVAALCAATSLAVLAGRLRLALPLMVAALAFAAPRPEAWAPLAWPLVAWCFAPSTPELPWRRLAGLVPCAAASLLLLPQADLITRALDVLAPSGALEGRPRLEKQLVSLVPGLMILLVARFADWRGSLVMLAGLGLTLLATATGAGVAGVSAATLLGGIGLLAAWLGSAAARRRPGFASALVLGAAILVLLLGRHTTTKMLQREQEEARQLTARALSFLEELGPAVEGEHRLVLGLPPSHDGLPGPGRLAPPLSAAGPSPLDGGVWTRVLQWAAPPSPGRPRIEDWSLETRFAAYRDTAGVLTLLEPADGAALACRVPGDEPRFVFSVDAARDPGPNGFVFHALATGPSTRWISRQLDPSVLDSRREAGRTIYTWQPSWRTRVGAVRELRWEREELAERGGELCWTVTLRRRPRELPLMAKPARVSALP